MERNRTKALKIRERKRKGKKRKEKENIWRFSHYIFLAKNDHMSGGNLWFSFLNLGKMNHWVSQTKVDSLISLFPLPARMSKLLNTFSFSFFFLENVYRHVIRINSFLEWKQKGAFALKKTSEAKYCTWGWRFHLLLKKIYLRVTLSYGLCLYFEKLLRFLWTHFSIIILSHTY